MKKYTCKVLVGGQASGEPLVSTKPFTFAHGVDPKTGLVTDVRSDIKGKNVRGKILVYPYGKGSTTSSAWFLETARLGNTPAGIVIATLDNGTVVGSILSGINYGLKIPVVLCTENEFYERAASASKITINEKGEVELA